VGAPPARVDDAILVSRLVQTLELALAEAERLDMNVWIYDENSYPSGFAGGWVPELMPNPAVAPGAQGLGHTAKMVHQHGGRLSFGRGQG